MKTKILLFSILFLTLFGCKKTKRPEPDFYKNLYTDEILDKDAFADFYQNIRSNFIDTTYVQSLLVSKDTLKAQTYVDSIMNEINLYLYFRTQIKNGDSIIQPFNYDIRIGNEYVVRANSYEKIGMEIQPQHFSTIDGENIQIGGKRDKPILINLWFVECPGCVAEIPALNRLEEKYADKVDFVAMTFETEKDVAKFLKRKEFNFKHVANVWEFINTIGTKPYPENIFINKNGCIEYVEGGLSNHEDLDLVIKYFEDILQSLIEE